MRMQFWSVSISVVLCHLLNPTEAFSPVSSDFITRRNSNIGNRKSSELYALHDQVLFDCGLSLISAFVGVASQLPQIRETEKDLQEAKARISQDEDKFVSKINELEQYLVVFDSRFEEQSEQFQNDYDKKKRNELDEVVKKMKDDLEFKFKLQLEKEKASLREEKLNFFDSVSKEEELTSLRLREGSLSESYQKLLSALEASEEEVNKMTEEADNKKKSEPEPKKTPMSSWATMKTRQLYFL